MTQIRQSDHGIVVDHLEAGVRYAISDRNYDVKVHRKVRELGPGESVIGYRPRPLASLGELASPTGSPSAAGEQAETQVAKAPDTKTEGAATAASQEKKEGN